MTGMMDIRKLQKKLLKEELKRRRNKSAFWRLVVPGTLVLLILVAGGLAYRLSRLDHRLEEDFLRAGSELAAGRHEAALADYEAILRRHPGFKRAGEALFQSAEIRNLYLRDYAGALADYQRLQKDYPGETVLVQKAQLRIAALYKSRQQDCTTAIVAYNRAIELGAGPLDSIIYEIADCYFRLEDYDRAAGAFERIGREAPASPLLPEVGYRVGTAYSLAGDNGRATVAFRAVMARWPQSPYAAEARFALASVLEERDEKAEALALLVGLEGVYANPEALKTKIALLKERMKKTGR